MNEELQVTQETLDYIRGMIYHSPNKLIAMSGVQVAELEERHIKLEMPLGDVHVNHVGTAYAISMIMLMEMAGASLLQCTYGVKKFVPILKRIDIRYQKPTDKTLVCDLSLTMEEAKKLIAPVLERGRGNTPLKIKLTDITGADIAEADFGFYLIPMDMKLV